MLLCTQSNYIIILQLEKSPGGQVPDETDEQSSRTIPVLPQSLLVLGCNFRSSSPSRWSHCKDLRDDSFRGSFDILSFLGPFFFLHSRLAQKEDTDNRPISQLTTITRTTDLTFV